MIKAAGLITAFIASASLGILKGYDYKKRIDILQNFKELLLEISSNMGYFKEPLPVIFKNIEPKTKDDAKRLLNHFIEKYDRNNEGLINLWCQSVDEVYSHTQLTDEDIEIIKSCSNFLGQSDFKTQQSHFEYIQNRIDQKLDEACEASKTKGRMYSKLGFCLGAVIVILLI